VAPGVLVYLDNRLFFANAGYVRGRIRGGHRRCPTPVRWLVFDAEALTHVDAAGVDALAELIRSLQREGSRWCSPASRPDAPGPRRRRDPRGCRRPTVPDGTVRRAGRALGGVIGCYRREWGSTSSRTMLIPSDPQRSPWPFGSHLLQPGADDEAWQQAWK
jgi:STAS domain